MAKSIVILFTLLACGFSNAQNFCNMRSCSNRPHTMCTYPYSGPGPRCNNVQGVGLSADEKQRVLNLHNKLRQKVANGQEQRGRPGPQPAATNMAYMEWDSELETIAQRWANQCQWGHDQCRNVERFKVGQNIAYSGTTGDVNSMNVEDLVINWYDEVKDFNRNDVSHFKSTGAMIGHYTQLVWAESTKLGCGAIKYQEGSYNRLYLICNYGPAGNMITGAVYQTR